MSVASEGVGRRVGAEAAADRRRVARRGERRDVRRSRIRRPARRSARSPTAAPTTRRRRSTPPSRRRPEWAATPPNERSEILHDGVREAERARRRAGDADDARDGQGGRRVEGRDRLLGRVLPLVRRRGAADRRLLQGGRQPGLAGARDAPAGRPLLLHHPLELPDGDGDPQARPGDRRRLHDGRSSRPSRRRSRCSRSPSCWSSAASPTASSTSSPGPRRARSRSRSSATRGCASSASPARPRSAAS